MLAHATNNMINDYFDTIGGVDTEGYTRTLYAPHPLFSNLISKEGLIAAIVACNLADLGIGVWLMAARGWPVAAFALAGLFISVFYVAPPLKLKHHGLGEPGVFVVWGPLMIGGTYYVTAGTLPSWIWLASVPYALVVTTVLIGKHVDKYEQDGARGIRTLPVILGREFSLRLNQLLMIAFYPIVALLVLRGTLGAGRAAGGARDPAAPHGAAGLQRAEARGPAARLSPLAALVRVARVLPQPAGGRPLRARARRQPVLGL